MQCFQELTKRTKSVWAPKKVSGEMCNQAHGRDNKALKTLEIINDLPIGFPINNIISF